MSMHERCHSQDHLPGISPLMMRFFLSVFRRQVRSSFHAMRLMRCDAGATIVSDGDDLRDVACDPIAQAKSLPMRPTVVVMNHPSWWDPATGMVLHDLLYPGRRQFAPVDERAIERYRFLGKIGCFAVEPDTARGAKQFLRAGDAILSHDDAMLWMTAQGKFTDVRQRPMTLRRGVGTLAQRHPRAVFVPLAVEYTFWDQKRPEVLFAFGRPLCADGLDGLDDLAGNSQANAAAGDAMGDPAVELAGQAAGGAMGDATGNPRNQAAGKGSSWRIVSPPSTDAATWTDCIAAHMTEAQDALRDAAMSRDADRFVTVLEGRSGISGIYDLWRRATAAVRGKSFDPAHEVYDRSPAQPRREQRHSQPAAGN